METQKKSLWQLFIRTFKIGALTWGGGYVIIPLLKTEFADKCRYIEESEIIDMVAVSQSLPGVISVNCCLMVGYRVRGARGALVAAMGVILPSMITLSFVTYFYSMFRDNAYVAAALNGVRACVVGLMLDAVLRSMGGAGNRFCLLFSVQCKRHSVDFVCRTHWSALGRKNAERKGGAA